MDNNNAEPTPSTEPIRPVEPSRSSSGSAPAQENPEPAPEEPESAPDPTPEESQESPEEPKLSSDDSEPSITATASSADPFRSAPPAQKKSPLKPIVISAVALLLVGVGVFAAFKYKDALAPIFSGEDSSSSAPTSTIVYSTPADSTDPVGDYVSYLEGRISSASTPIEKLSATLDLADFLTRNDQVPRAVAILDSVSTSDFTTDREFYAFYSAYAKTYSPSFLNDPDLYAEYSALAEQYNPYPTATSSE